MNARFVAALAIVAALAPAAAFAQKPTPGAEPLVLASLTVREQVVFRNTTQSVVNLSVTTGEGEWKTYTIQPGGGLKYSCTGCTPRASITTVYEGRKVRRVEASLQSGYAYEIFLDARYSPKIFAFRKTDRT